MSKSKVVDPNDPTPELPGEGSKAYGAFLLYRDLGRWRSLEKLRAELDRQEAARGSGKGRRAIRPLERWCSLYRWVERCQAYDRRMDAIRRKSADEAAVADVVLWAKRHEYLLHQSWITGEALRNKCVQMLNYPIDAEIEVDENGHKVTVTRPSKWTFGTIAIMLKAATELQMEACRAATKEDDQEFSDEQLRAMSLTMPGRPGPSEVEGPRVESPDGDGDGGHTGQS